MLRVRLCTTHYWAGRFLWVVNSFCKEVQVTCGSVGSVGIVTTGYRMYGSGFESLYRHNVHVGSGSHPDSYSSSTGIISPGSGGIERPGVTTHSLSCSRELRMSGVIPSLRLYDFMAWAGTSSPWHILQNVPSDSVDPPPPGPLRSHSSSANQRACVHYRWSHVHLRACVCHTLQNEWKCK